MFSIHRDHLKKMKCFLLALIIKIPFLHKDLNEGNESSYTQCWPQLFFNPFIRITGSYLIGLVTRKYLGEFFNLMNL